MTDASGSLLLGPKLLLFLLNVQITGERATPQTPLTSYVTWNRALFSPYGCAFCAIDFVLTLVRTYDIFEDVRLPCFSTLNLVGLWYLVRVVEKYKWEPLVHFLSKFDGHDGRMIALIRGTLVCSSSDTKIRMAPIINSFHVDYSSVLIFNAVIFGPTTSHLPNSIFVRVQIWSVWQGTGVQDKCRILLDPYRHSSTDKVLIIALEVEKKRYDEGVFQWLQINNFAF